MADNGIADLPVGAPRGCLPRVWIAATGSTGPPEEPSSASSTTKRISCQAASSVITLASGGRDLLLTGQARPPPIQKGIPAGAIPEGRPKANPALCLRSASKRGEDVSAGRVFRRCAHGFRPSQLSLSHRSTVRQGLQALGTICQMVSSPGQS